jgi:CSLREA domain-containing protein
MTSNRLIPALAFAATGALASGLALTSTPADAAPTQHAAPAAHIAPSHRDARGTPLSHAQLQQARVRQHQLAARSKTPTFAKAGSKTFTVNTTEDSALANPAGTTCVDVSTGKCSLRAAVEAANNLGVAVKIVLGKHTYTLSAATVLTVSNHKGVSVVGQGAGKTAIAGDGSGIFYVAPTTAPGSLFLTSLKLKNGTSTDGGAVQLDSTGVTLSLDHVAASNNTASGAGGAIYASEYAGIYISHSTFTHNHSPEGGALYQYWSSVKISDSSFDGNSTTAGAAGYGGAIYNDYGVFDMTGGSISGNTAGDASNYGEGGAIYDGSAMTSLSQVHVDGNTATDSGEGGAIYGTEDALEINHGTMSHNHANGASGSGGGVYTYYESTLAAHGVTMAGNHAGGNSDGYGGGAIFAYGYEYPTQVVIDGGTKITGSNGSAVYLYNYEGGVDASISDSTLSDNLSGVNNGYDGLGCGGAVCAYAYEYGGLNLEMQGNHVSGNSSVGNYSAGAVTTYAYEYASASVVLRKNTFSKNHSGAGGYGGAVGFYSSDEYSPISVRMAANRFTANRAGTQGSAGWGGAVSAYYAVTITDKGSHFTHNRALGDGAYGGAVSDLGYYGTAAFARSTFTGNSAGTNKATNAGYGGAVYTYVEEGTAIDQVTMSGNKASSAGGGVYADSDAYDVKVTASTISGNTAGTSAQAGYGGGLYIYDAVATIQNSTVTGNRTTSITGTPGYGGGVYYSGTRFALDYSTVSGNYSKQAGGIYGETFGSVLGSILSKNRTSPHGSETDCRAASSVYRLVSDGGNVLGQKSCVVSLQKSDKVSKNAHLGKLANNGGPTKTMAISAKSPAVGRATYLVPTTDQRGHGRPANHADSGAFELPKQH